MTGTDSAPSTTTAEPDVEVASPAADRPDDLAGSRRRPSKWDRPPAPHDWRWWVGSAGKVLIALGLLLFGFVAYQLWGTGIETARAQRALENEFEELLATAPAPAAPDPADDDGATGDPDEDPAGDDTAGDDGSTGDPDDGSEATAPHGSAEAPLPPELQVIPEVENGDALARIEIPAIGVDDIVVAGVEPGDLKKGPGHYPDTPLPGQLGNAAIAGHRTTYGQPFHDVDDLRVGDEIVVTTLSGTYTYLVTGQQIVSPSDYQVVATTDASQATLTLTSCHPKWSARERIIISGELDPDRSGPIGEAVLDYGREPADADAGDERAVSTPDDDTTAGGTTTSEATDDTTGDDTTGDAGAGATAAGASGQVVSEDVADAFSDGWFSDPGAYPHVAGWGFLLTAIAVGAWLLSRRVRHDSVGALVAVVPFVVTLYFFFQNVNRMLPPNL